MNVTENKTVLDPEMLTEALKAQTKDTIESLLENAVKSYLKEEAAKDEDLEDDDADKVEPTGEQMDDEPMVDEVPADGGAADAAPQAQAEPVDGGAGEPVDGDGDEWSNFDDYKVGDGEYDMTGVNDPEQIARVWKLMGDEDNVVVKQQGDGKVELKDNESGAEYLIDLGGLEDEPEAAEAGGEEPVFEITFNSKPVMNEENLGYTDNYQDKDVVVGKEPYDSPTPNKTRNWDAGAPDGKSKPWAGPSKTKGKPYAGDVNEEDEMGGDLYEIEFDECGSMPVDGPMEEGASFGAENSMRLNPGNEVHDEPHRRRHNDKVGNMSDGTAMNESVMKKLAKIEEENKVLKSSLVKFRKALSESVMTNYNIGKFVDLIIENSTSKQEKIDILKRFSNEAKTKEQSNALYESINKQLKSVKKGGVAIDKPMNINESAVKNINESTIYKSDDESINYALDMIQRMNNL